MGPPCGMERFPTRNRIHRCIPSRSNMNTTPTGPDVAMASPCPPSFPRGHPQTRPNRSGAARTERTAAESVAAQRPRADCSQRHHKWVESAIEVKNGKKETPLNIGGVSEQVHGGRYWTRTSDLVGVNDAL